MALKFQRLNLPTEGQRMVLEDGRLKVPSNPVIPFIEGDGTGPEIWSAARPVYEEAVEKAYGGKRRVAWFEIFAGEKARDRYGEWLPNDTLEAISAYLVAIKGPLTTPIGGGYRSLNVALRQKLNLYACIRPVRYFEGVPSPVRRPQDLDIVIFRENTEDVYAGIEWREGTEKCRKVLSFLNREMGTEIPEDAALGIKITSATASKRLVRKALRYAIEKQKESVTLVHKGNIMKYTEGAFKEWGYQVAREEFPDYTLTEEDLKKSGAATPPKSKVLVKDRIADSMFQQLLTRPREYSVLATPNLNGDYLSDAAAAQAGGLGMAPGANLGDTIALFEATHGSAPAYAGQDKVNPGSLILSGAMMFEYLGWLEVTDFIVEGVRRAIKRGRVTYDLARQLEGATEVKCSEFARSIVEEIRAL
ncbi:MAG TPA: isocitrate dehydrogenase (NADP(+)) [Candidatus Polarisedimenticolia bacterium]|nr:isocitrate dehydrogenase (NADP(+)) [Candidatus Polarisedimenticolia bacterium]